MTTPMEITKYLQSIKTVESAIPCTVTISGTTYPSCWYRERLTVSPGCPAYARGDREYTREMIYCVGMLPKVKVRGNVAFTSEGWSYEWYVAGYFGGIVNRVQELQKPNGHHPFGNMFLLAPWDVNDGSSIDHYERVPYKRVRCTVELVKEVETAL